MPQIVPAVIAAAKWVWAAKTFVAAAVKFVATTAAVHAVSRALQPKSSLGSIRATGMQVNVRDPAAPRAIIYGQRKVSGVLYPVGVSGSANEYLHLLLLVAGHEVEELGDVYFNDEVVTLDGSGNATGTYAGVARIKKHLGTYNETVDTALQTDLGSSYWSSAHKLGGIAYLYIRLKFNQEKFAGGVPEFWVMCKGRKVWDPRDSGQSATDPATWTWSSNAALCLLDWVRGVPMRNSAGTLVRNFGLRAADAEISESAVEEAANVCDETVVLADATTEARYAAHGVLYTNTLAGDGIEALRSAMAGECVFVGGAWLIRAGAYRSPTVTITDSDLRGPLVGVQVKPSRRELCNGVKGVFIAAANNWQPADFPPVTNSTYTTQDGGERLWHDVEWPFTVSNATAQRLAKIVLERSRQAISLTARCKLTAMQVQVTDVVNLTHARFGWSAKPFEVVSFAFVVENDAAGNPYLGVDLGLRETASGVWDWANGEETAIDLAPNTDLPGVLDVGEPSSLSVSNSVTQQEDGTTVPRLAVTWTAPSDIHVTSGGLIRLEYKLTAASDWLPVTTMRGDITSAFILAVVIGQAYTVRVRAESNLGVASDWVTSGSVTVTGDATGPAAPGTPTVTAYPGFNRAVWTASSAADVSEYRIYRNTSNTTVGATLLGETAGLDWDDPTATPGTAYYYFISAVDFSDNEGSKTSAGSVTTALAPVGAAVPSAPTAATKSADGTYLAGDGTVFSSITMSVPALPTNAVWQNVLYRRNGATEWLVAAQLKNTGTVSVRIDDLTPGVSYDVATQAWSGAGGSSETTATSSPFTAPNSTSGPATPSGGVLSGQGVVPKYYPFGNAHLPGCVISWAENTEADLAHYEVKATGTDSDGAVDYTWTLYDLGGTGPFRTTENRITLYNLTASAGYVRVRAVNSTGVASAWYRIGNANTAYSIGAGNMAVQSSSAVAISGGDIDNFVTTAITTGGGSSSREVVCVLDANEVFALSGGAYFESENFSLTNRGFSTKPDVGLCVVVDPPGDLDVFYDWTHASNSSTNAVITFVSRDHSTAISAGNRRVHIRLVEYD